MTTTTIGDQPAHRAPDTLVLQPGRIKLAVYLTICAVFVVMGFSTLQAGFAMSWLPIIAFSAGGLVFLSQFSARFASLTLQPEGFSVRQLWSTASYRWEDIERFHCDNPSWLGSVYFIGEPIYPTGDENRIVLPDTYGLGAERLAAVLNAWKKGSRAAA